MARYAESETKKNNMEPCQENEEVLALLMISIRWEPKSTTIAQQ